MRVLTPHATVGPNGITWHVDVPGKTKYVFVERVTTPANGDYYVWREENGSWAAPKYACAVDHFWSGKPLTNLDVARTGRL